MNSTFGWQKKPLTGGFEPPTFRLTAERSTDWATRATIVLSSSSLNFIESFFLPSFFHPLLNIYSDNISLYDHLKKSLLFFTILLYAIALLLKVLFLCIFCSRQRYFSPKVAFSKYFIISQSPVSSKEDHQTWEKNLASTSIYLFLTFRLASMKQSQNKCARPWNKLYVYFI